jgi:hypothetical protein
MTRAVTPAKPATLPVYRIVAADLAFRDSANRFFDRLEAMPQPNVTVDFRKVRSITRAFAHQYLLRKEASTKQISETNVPQNVRRMFDIVRSPPVKARPLIPKPLKVVSLQAAGAY